MGKLAKVLKTINHTLDMSETARMSRMREAGLERGYYRGAKRGSDELSYFTPDKRAAEAFANRFGDLGEVKEYALRQSNNFDFHGNYSNSDMPRITDSLRKNGFDKLADDIADLPGDYGGEMPAKLLYQVLQTETGAPERILRDAGFDFIDAGQEMVSLNKAGTIRDAAKAAFDLSKRQSSDVLAGIAGATVVGAALSGSDKAAAKQGEQDGLNELKQFERMQKLDEIKKNLRQFMEAGGEGLFGTTNLLGSVGATYLEEMLAGLAGIGGTLLGGSDRGLADLEAVQNFIPDVPLSDSALNVADLIHRGVDQLPSAFNDTATQFINQPEYLSDKVYEATNRSTAAAFTRGVLESAF